MGRCGGGGCRPLLLNEPHTLTEGRLLKGEGKLRCPLRNSELERGGYDLSTKFLIVPPFQGQLPRADDEPAVGEQRADHEEQRTAAHSSRARSAFSATFLKHRSRFLSFSFSGVDMTRNVVLYSRVLYTYFHGRKGDTLSAGGSSHA